jgi:hypothetical protein
VTIKKISQFESTPKSQNLPEATLQLSPFTAISIAQSYTTERQAVSHCCTLCNFSILILTLLFLKQITYQFTVKEQFAVRF